MCDIAAAIGLVSSLVGAAGSIQQANATADAERYNAKVASMNARISGRMAHDAQVRGAQDEQRKRFDISQVKGRQEAAMAANGLDISFGSPLDTLVDTATLGELDALTIRSNFMREAYGHKVNQANRRAEQQLHGMNADAAESAGYLSAAGTLLTGAGNAYGSWRSSYSSPGVGSIY